MKVVAMQKGLPFSLEFKKIDNVQLADKQIRIKTTYCGVARADILWIWGKLPGSPKTPFTPGYDLVGKVVEIGKGVTRFEVGDQVAVLQSFGSYTSESVVQEHQALKVDNKMDLKKVLPLVLNYLTAYQLQEKADLQKGDTALIHGAGGGLGTAFLDLAKARGIRVYGTASSSKHDTIRSLNGLPIDYKSQDFVSEILRSEPDGVKLVVDHIGGKHLSRSFKVVSKGGSLISVASLAALNNGLSIPKTAYHMFLRNFIRNILPNGKKAGFYEVVNHFKKDAPSFQKAFDQLQQLLLEGEINPVIHKVLPFDEVIEALETIDQSQSIGKVILKF